MKKLFFTLLFFGFCFIVSAQSEPKVGDELIVKEPYTQNFKYVKFPKLNTLTKRGKVANYKSVYGDTVIVDEVMTKDDSKFFGLKTTVKANYAKAIEAGELSTK